MVQEVQGLGLVDRALTVVVHQHKGVLNSMVDNMGHRGTLFEKYAISGLEVRHLVSN